MIFARHCSVSCDCHLFVQNDMLDNSAWSEKYRIFFFISDWDFLTVTGTFSFSKTQTLIETCLVHHNSKAKFHHLSQGYLHIEIVPYQIVSASFDIKSHNMSFGLPSDYRAPKDNKVSLLLNGFSQLNSLQVHKGIGSSLSVNKSLTSKHFSHSRNVFLCYQRLWSSFSLSILQSKIKLFKFSVLPEYSCTIWTIII